MRQSHGLARLSGVDGTNAIISTDLVRAIRLQYRLAWRGIHGVTHWARVLENGLHLAAHTGARIKVVSLFALFHDSMRENDDYDPDHGRRGADFAASLRGLSFELGDEDFALLKIACDHHTDGLTEADVTVQTCWDADRLDLGRVGVTPDPDRLCTEIAKAPATIAWATERSTRRHASETILQEWKAT